MRDHGVNRSKRRCDVAAATHAYCSAEAAASASDTLQPRWYVSILAYLPLLLLDAVRTQLFCRNSQRSLRMLRRVGSVYSQQVHASSHPTLPLQLLLHCHYFSEDTHTEDVFNATIGGSRELCMTTYGGHCFSTFVLLSDERTAALHTQPSRVRYDAVMKPADVLLAQDLHASNAGGADEDRCGTSQGVHAVVRTLNMY
ncbi:MAG: hypothetical protein EBZ75_14290 [Oxalobacteraceae bacterium]|nr:hypothetical protein [Oxalobacteraceae bacterium]